MLTEGIAGELEAEQREFVETIHDKGEQLLPLIMGLLDLSKLESGTMQHDAAQRSRIEPVLGEVVSTLTPTARKKGGRARCSTSRRARRAPRRSRASAAGVHQPCRERAQVHARRGHGHAARADVPSADGDAGDEDGLRAAGARAREASRCASTTPASASRPARGRRSSTPSTRSTRRARASTAARGSGLSIVKRLVEAHAGAIRIEDNAPHGTVSSCRCRRPRRRRASPCPRSPSGRGR